MWMSNKRDCAVIRLVSLKEARERGACETQCSSVATDRQLHHLKSSKKNTGEQTGTRSVCRVLVISRNFLVRFSDRFHNLSTNSLKLSHVGEKVRTATALPDGSVGSVRNTLLNNHPAGVFEARLSTEDLGFLCEKFAHKAILNALKA